MKADVAKVQATASISHLGVVVSDTEKAKQMLETLFGIGPWWTAVAEVETDQMISGPPFKARATQARLLENTLIELIEPLGPSIWSEFITSSGGGLHHICFEVSNWQEMVHTVEKLGGKMLVGAHVFGKRFCYMGLPTGLVVEFTDEHIHDDANKLLKREPLPAVSMDGGHIGAIVKDTEKAKELYGILGYETWWTEEVTFRQNSMTLGNVKTSDTLLANRTILELREPTSGWSSSNSFFKPGSGSLSHIGFEVSNREEMIAKIKSVGGKTVFDADVWGKTAQMRLPIGLVVEISTMRSRPNAQKMFGIIE
jgi:catechol 2,3-dioxygenase-like lactoylglutathione lyase family enzyme